MTLSFLSFLSHLLVRLEWCLEAQWMSLCPIQLISAQPGPLAPLSRFAFSALAAGANKFSKISLSNSKWSIEIGKMCAVIDHPA